MLLNRNKRLELRKTKEFRSTNKIWNDLGLNHKKKIGCLMFIAKQSKAKNFEEWESYYFESGNKRQELLKSNPQKNELIQINNEYGRTKEDLLEIAKELNKKVHMPLATLYNFVYIRVIDETWIGLNRELKALKIIEGICKNYDNLTVTDVDYYKDIEYAIDFEIKLNNYPILAIQLKSDKYLKSNLKSVYEIKNINKHKNTRYTNKYGVNVLYLYINRDNEIQNINDLISFLNENEK